MSTQREGGHLQAEQRGLRGNRRPPPHHDLHLRLLASRRVNKCISIVEAPPSVVFCDGSPANTVGVE